MKTVELSLVIPVKDEEVAIGPCLARVIPILEAMMERGPMARATGKALADFMKQHGMI